MNNGHRRIERRRRLGDVRPVGGRTRERPRRVGEHEWRGDDKVHAAGGRQDDGSQAALHNESVSQGGPDSGAVRERWGVENGLDRTLGAPFGEDGSAVRVGHAAENMSTIRRLALNPMKGEKSLKSGGGEAEANRLGFKCLRAIFRLAQ